MQSRLTKCFALGGMLALLSSSLTVPVQSRNLLAVNGPAQAVARASEDKGQNNDSASFKGNEGSGTLLAMATSGKVQGQCPLKHTDVSCDISGYVARVTVKQTFHNPYKNKIEALYTFPLSESGAVDEMLMKVGDRTIHGTIKKREEAKQIYDQAKANGQVASLLDQERTNIFTQSVANIEPGKEIEITIKYVETLPYEKGKYSFAFPTVVGPRFIPGQATGHSGSGREDDTTNVPDASRITPPVTPENTRSGHDISINVHLNAGMPITDVSSKLHQVKVDNDGANQANISLVDKNTIANKDFVLTWNVAQDALKSGYLTYKNPQSKDGFFTVMLVPPKKVKVEQIAPKEMIFVIDCSGSQSGPPLQKCKETMRYILDHMNADDTFQIIAFSSQTRSFAEHPQKVSAEMKKRANAFIGTLEANGGTWMAPAVEQACKIPADDHRLRIVTFMTDGYVGNDFEILSMIKKLRGVSRWFPFGTGNSVNRMLIDGIAKEGGGEPDYVLLNSSGEAAGKKFYDRISTPVLTDIKVKFDGVQVKDVYPKEVSDVWAERPLYFKGKYTAGGAGTITLTGYSGGKPYEQKLAVNFPDNNQANPGIASLWARAKVDRLMSEDYMGAQNGAVNKELKDEIVATALEHHIMTQYTSFVAVDEKQVTKNGKLETVTVPVEMPDGVSREKTLRGEQPAQYQLLQTFSGPQSRMAVRGRAYGPKGNIGHYAQYGMVPGAAGAFGGMAASVPMAPAANYQSGALMAAPSPSASPAKPIVGSPLPQKMIVADAAKTLDKRTIGEPTNGPVNKAKDEQTLQLEMTTNVRGNINKLSQAAQSLLKSDTSAVDFKAKNPAVKGDRVMVIIKAQNLTAVQRAKLKALGLEISNKQVKEGEIKGLIKISKLLDLANLDFVLSVLLDSDRK